jgi:hypothetical protein
VKVRHYWSRVIQVNVGNLLDEVVSDLAIISVFGGLALCFCLYKLYLFAVIMGFVAAVCIFSMLGNVYHELQRQKIKREKSSDKPSIDL